MAIYLNMKTSPVELLSMRLKAVSDPTRIKILVLLGARPCCVCELTEVLRLSQPTVSRHLKQLEQTGFIKGAREKNWIIYQLAPADETSVRLLELVDEWASAAPETAVLLKRLENADRNLLNPPNTHKSHEGHEAL